MDEIRDKIRQRFGDISPKEMAKILNISIKKSLYMEGGSELTYIEGEPVIFIGYGVSLLLYPKVIAKEIKHYLAEYPEIMENW